MGITRCVLPGCSTRYGDGTGRMIKKFPNENPDVVPKWMQVLSKVSSKTALCEVQYLSYV